ncbi:MAG: hypothetical protein U1E27_02445, partial [Kiritimatiellia bacterium]|nr:hypothetical protein [Kiritimatiellia bacterium]
MSGGIESGRTSWPSAVELLREWVAIPSVNPSFSTSPEWTGEARMAESLAARLTALGGRVVLEPVFPGRPNVVARFAPPRPIRRTILLAPHLDTVGVGGMT